MTSIGNRCFSSLNNLTRIVLSTNLKRIRDKCFNNIPLVKELSFPDSLTFIGSEVLAYQMKGLTALAIPTHWIYHSNRFFINTQSLCSLIIPENVKYINGKPFAKELQDHFTVPTTVTKLNNCCFHKSKYRSITIPSSVVEIGDSCFEEMKLLESIEIPSTVTKFGKLLFSDCISLTSIILHENYKRVGNCDFYNCRKLSHIDLPTTLTSIGDAAFKFCFSLTSMTIPPSCISYGQRCFSGSGMASDDSDDFSDGVENDFPW